MNKIWLLLILATVIIGCEKSNKRESPPEKITLLGGEEYQFLSYKSKKSTKLVWDFGDGTQSTEEDPYHAYATPGYYTVVLRAYKNQKLIYADNRYIVEVNQLYKPRISHVTTYPSGEITVDVATTFYIQLAEELDRDDYSYAFYLDDDLLYKGTSYTLDDMVFETPGFRTLKCKIFDENNVSGTYDTTFNVQN